MVFYFVIKELVKGTLLQRYIDGDDEFRNSRLKLIPSVSKVSCSLFFSSFGVLANMIHFTELRNQLILFTLDDIMIL